MLPSLLLAAALLQDDVTTLTLRYERMHCDECRSETEAVLKRLPGFKSVSLGETSAEAQFLEKSPPPSPSGLPRDIGLKRITLSLRGTAAAAGDRLVFQARLSGTSYTLVNPAKDGADRLAELRAALGGKNRFRIMGTPSGKDFLLESFKPAEWAD
jgi:copper chaperone CopZ